MPIILGLGTAGGGGESSTATSTALPADTWYSTSGGASATTWQDVTLGSADNQLYIGNNSTGWWNLTTGLRYQVNIPKGATVTEAKLRIYKYGAGSGFSSNVTCNIYVYNVDSASVPANSSAATSLYNGSKTQIGSFAFGNSTPPMGWNEFTLSNSSLTSHFARAGWAANNYVGLMLQQLPAVRPVGEDELKWTTFESGTGNSELRSQLIITYTTGAPEPVTVTVYPTANADTATATTSSIFVTDPLYLLDSTSSSVLRGIARFPSVAVPKNATITSAYFDFVVKWYNNYPPASYTSANDYLIVSVDQADNSAQATTAAAVNSRYTGAPSGVNFMKAQMNGGDGSYATSPDISSYIQSVVNRAGWASGNAISVVWSDNPSRVNGLAGESYASGSGSSSKIPRLRITYTP